MNEKVKHQFNAAAAKYDEQRRQLIPCFDDFYGSAVQWLNLGVEAPRILDLGAGTGLLSAFVRRKYPLAHLTLIDMSENMLSEAERRFSDHARMTYIAADFTSYLFEGTYDGVVSSLSIHHLTHPDKRALFRTVFGLLKNGGVFINADQVKGQTPYIDRQYKDNWEKAINASGLSRDAVLAAIDRRKLDVNAIAQEQIAWLREAGFTDADSVFQYHDFAVFFARKGSSLGT